MNERKVVLSNLIVPREMGVRNLRKAIESDFLGSDFKILEFARLPGRLQKIRVQVRTHSGLPQKLLRKQLRQKIWNQFYFNNGRKEHHDA